MPPGQTPPVQNVCHTVPQLGTHHQRSCNFGRYLHLGQ